MNYQTKLLRHALVFVIPLLLMLTVAAPICAADEPFTTMSTLNSTTPFNVTLPSTLSNGKPVKNVVIEFVTADCSASAGTTLIGSAFIKVVFGGNFFYYTLPFQPGLETVSNVEFSSAWKTLMYADPGSTLNYGLSAGNPTCTVVFSGHLVPA